MPMGAGCIRGSRRFAWSDRESGMNGFISRVIATVMLAIVLELVVALTGLVNMRTDNPPSKIETILAGQAMDASVERAAPQVANPTAAGEANPLAGARLYR